MTSSFSWCSTFPAQTHSEPIGEAQNTFGQSAHSKLVPITEFSTEGGEKPRAGQGSRHPKPTRTADSQSHCDFVKQSQISAQILCWKYHDSR